MNNCVLSFQRNNDRLEEWINHYKKIGFNWIIIIDNNDYENRLKLDIDHVIVLPFNGPTVIKESFWLQNEAYDYAFKYIKKLDIDYLCICDDDEYLILSKYNSVNDFIQYEMIDKNIQYAKIYWTIYDDNDIIYEKNEKSTLIETYTRIQSKEKNYDYENNECSNVKSIFLFNNIIDKLSNCGHGLTDESVKKLNYNCKIIDPNIATFNHYRTRCLEHYIKSKCLSNGFGIKTEWYVNDILKGYNMFNNINEEKLTAFLQLYKQYFNKDYENIEYLNELRNTQK